MTIIKEEHISLEPFFNERINDGYAWALKVINYEHHEIHAGSHFYLSGNNDLAINNVFDMQFTTPNTSRWIHFTFELLTEKETAWYIYEGATISTAGTAVTPVNNDRNSSKTSGATVATILNASVADANADTPVAGATLIMSGVLGDRQTAGAVSRDREIILKQNTIYCMRAVATVAGNVSFMAQWYEHTNID